MKQFKLIVHQKNFSGEDLIINPKSYNGIMKGDIVEIYHPEDEFSRLLLQITSFKEDSFKDGDTISVEQGIATAFQLRTFTDVYMNIVNPDDVSLDSVELTFKDQYMGRSEMWRLKNSLVNTCVYMNKKIEFCGGSIRCQVYEMWSQGDRVACGVITNDTKVVFRSSTSMVYLFIQMSSEMWDFDIHGDLYFEKAVNGFLADLFQKWKKNGSNHETTIVLFSRTFYKGSNVEEFPLYMRECLQQDYKGRYYEDFYRVAVQNERYDDWTNTLVQLRRLFTDYQKNVLEYHKRPGFQIPKAVNSTAAQGNFLEVLNMSLNVFEKHYLDRSFDRTGQLSVVITPGVGIFEVDRELTNVTKQRIIDNGVGSDLVCVGEQPLHAVPLLKFHNKDTSVSAADDYSMPHWINLSFYSTNKKVAYSTFIPRIKLPPKRTKPSPSSNGTLIQTKSKLLQEDECMPNSLFDYDAYDAQVFQLPPVHTTRFSHSLQRTNSRQKKTSVSTLDGQTGGGGTAQKVLKRKTSDPDIHHGLLTEVVGSPTSLAGTTPRSAAISIPTHRSVDLAGSPHLSASIGAVVYEAVKPMIFPNVTTVPETELSPPYRPIVGSAGSPGNPAVPQGNVLRPGRALINPFDPSHVTIKLTSNRRRWTHIFPKGPTGVLIQQHHYQAVPSMSTSDQQTYDSGSTFSTSPVNDTPIAIVGSPLSASQLNSQENLKCRSGRTSLQAITPLEKPNKSLTLLWGATGEQEWTPALTTGVDWKSLTIPACLPITTDYFPDKRSLQNDYVVSDYNLLPDDVNADFAQQRAIYKKPLTTAEVFRELVSQRLAQGFQLIVLTKGGSKGLDTQASSGSNQAASQLAAGSLVMSRAKDIEPGEEYFLSIGRVFHKISLSGSAITVTRYRPRHPYPPFNIHYRYRFHAPNHDTYEISWVSFTTEKLENFNWNYLDHYICTRGDTDFCLAEAQKYWRFRVYLLPLNHQATKKILEGSENCDIYSPIGVEEQSHMLEGFLKFMESWVNKIRRPNSHKKQRSPAMPTQATKGQHESLMRRHSINTVLFHSHNSNSSTNMQTSVVGNSPFRERLGSNRVLEKPRPRSGSKVMKRVKAESGGSGRASPANESGMHADKGLAQQLTLSDQLNDHDPSEEGTTPTLKANATNTEILEALCHPLTGVGFVAQHASLPSHTFVSADAVQWLVLHVEGVDVEDAAVAVVRRMLDERLVCHASGDFSHPFIVGFYLYHVVQRDKDGEQPLGDLQSFENEWLEVAVKHPTAWKQPTVPSSPPVAAETPTTVPRFLKDTLDEMCVQDKVADEKGWSVPLYKHTHLEIDINSKSDRIEWGHARYQSLFQPDRAYELVVQWVCSSGTIVSELILGWARKAQTCGLQMIPIPHDPLALPFTKKSDPLRGPIFIPMDTECLMGKKSYLFEEFREETWGQRLFLFQAAIIERFGFVRCTMESSDNDHEAVTSSNINISNIAHHHMFVHLTGNVFILIPSQPCLHPHPRSNSVSQRVGLPRQLTSRRYPVHSESMNSPHEEYITRHVSGKNKDDYGTDRRVGFLWSWNHMVSRKWKSSSMPATGEEIFQKKIIKDFREFCSNNDNRLRRFWESCWALK